MLYHQERRTDIEGPHVPAACEGVAAAPGEMARITGHRSPVPATLSRSSHERAFPRSVRKTNRNCPRNEGLSRKHNPEFTMLEAYWAYADFETMANLAEELICYLAEKICGLLIIEHRGADGKIVRTINLQRPWRRARYHDVVREVAGRDWFELSREQRRDRATNEFKLEILPQLADFEVTQHVFEKLVEEKTVDPLFVTHCPKEL